MTTALRFALRPFTPSAGLVALAGLGFGALVSFAAGATGPAVAGFEAYDRTFPALLEKWQVPGGAVAVAYRGRIVFARGYGLADRDTGRLVSPDTRFRTMSVAKPITAAMVLKLVEDGRLALGDRAFDLLGYPTPAYSGAARDARLGQITVAHLLNHSGGWVAGQATSPLNGGRGFYPTNNQREIAALMGVAPPASAETLVRFMVGQPLQAAPGTVFSYSPLGYEVLGRLIELKTGLTYERAVQAWLLSAQIGGAAIGGSRRSELAADEAVYYDHPGAALTPSHFGDGGLVPWPYALSLRSWDSGGGWSMSAIECLRFLLALDGAGAMPRLLRSETVNAMQTAKPPSTFYGYGWYSSYWSPGGYAGHGGGSWGSKTWALRSDDGAWHVVAFVNSLPAEALAGGAAFESDAYRAIDALPVGFMPPAHDFTPSTLVWEAWQQRHFSGTGADELADSDRDGVSNLLEYAAGLDPTRADSVSAASVTRTADGPATLTYRRLILEHPLTWTVEISADAQTWSAVQTPPSATVLNPDGTLSVTVPLPAASRARLRVRRTSTGATAALDFDLATPRAPTITEHPISRTVAAGGSATFSVTAASSLPLAYQWLRDGQPIAGATSATLAVSATTPAAGGDYTVVVTHAAASITSRPARLVVAAPEPGRLVNLSVRSTAGVGGQPLIVGFVVAGGAKPLLIRVVGPGLAAFGLSGTLPDPRLDLHGTVNGADQIVASNDDWDADPAARAVCAAAGVAAGAFPLAPGSRDAAVLVAVDGARTVHASGPARETSGMVLVETYDAGTANSPRLINLSVRNWVGTGADVLIAGFSISGNTPKRLLIRAVGPALESLFGLAGVLGDPRLELHASRDGRDTVIALNDDWADEPGAAAAVRAAGTFALPPGSRDAALVVTVPAGTYSVILNGANGTTGHGLIEVYEIE